MLVDLAMVMVLWLPLAFLVAVLMGKGWFGPIPDHDIVLAANVGPGRWVFMPLALIYFIFGTWIGNGRTFGKKCMHIRVVSVEHPRITLWTSTERTLGYSASMLELGFGFLQYFIHHNRQTVHDRIAETVVIDETQRAPVPEFSSFI